MNITKILHETKNTLIAHKVVFLSVLPFPIAVIAAADYLAQHSPNTIVLNLIVYLFSMFFYASVAIFIHRQILLGQNAVNPSPFIPKSRVFKFILYCFAFGLCLIPVALLYLIPVIGMFLTVLGIAYLSSRLSLIFPAIAIDEDWTFTDSWQATKNNQKPMFLAIGLLPLVLSIPEWIPIQSQLFDLFVSIFSALTLVLVVATLSVCFEHLRSHR